MLPTSGQPPYLASTSPLITSETDRPFTLDDIETNPQKVIAQLIQQGHETLFKSIFNIDEEDLAVLPENLAKYRQLIDNQATTTVDKAKYGRYVDALQLINEFCRDILSGIIREAVRDNDLDIARQCLQSTLFKTYQPDLANSLIFSVCESNENEAIRMFELLHEINADFNCFNDKGETPLLVIASNSPHLTVLKKLIDIGADVNKATNKYMGTPLRSAACSGKPDFVQLLLDSGADAKIDGVCEVPDFIITIWSGLESHKLNDYLNIIELLVSAGVDVDRKNYSGCTPLKNAITNGLWAIADVLIKLGAKTDPSMVNDAIQSGNEKCIRGLIEKKCVLPEDIPFIKANYHDTTFETSIKLEIFQLCFDSGMSLRNFSLANHVVLKTPKAVEHFLDMENINLNINIPKIRPHVLNAHISPDVGPGAKGCSLAHYAAVCATRESLTILIKAGLNIHEQDSDGLTPLHYAAAYANPEAVKLLIFAGADINAVDNWGMTPLHWAVQNGEEESIHNLPCARVLLYVGASAETKDDYDRTPLGCLYTNEYSYNSYQYHWDRAFNETKPRKPEELKEFVDKVYSLQEITINAILDANASVPGLSYPDKIPQYLEPKIEDEAFRRLTPPALDFTIDLSTNFYT